MPDEHVVGRSKTAARILSEEGGMRLSLRLLLAVVCLVLVGGLGESACAQSSSTGALTGTVTDATGGAVAGAVVSLTSAATQQTVTKTTPADGQYKFALLAPGEYSMKVSKTGFETVSVVSVIINVTETAQKDVTLPVGASQQQVTVESTAQTVQTQESTVGTLVNSQEVNAIPLTTRNYTQILSLSAGVASSVNDAANLGRGSVDMSVNGNGPSANTYMMDGSQASNWVANAVTDQGAGQTGGVAIVNPDAIAEFKVQTAQYDASFGRTPGGAVNVVTKSGSNDIHGSAFEFLRNDVFNANDFFLAKNGEPRPVLKQNQFGGTFGGPIKKDKLFYFGSYQGTRQRNGLTTNSLSTVSLPALTNDRSAATIGQEFCPANKAASAQAAYETFAGGVQIACDGSNINPVALALLQKKLSDGSYLIPTPQTVSVNAQGVPVGQSSFSIPADFREDQFLINTDYIINSKNTLTERYFYSYDPEVLPFNGDTIPGYGADIVFKNHDATLKLTTLLTTNLVNEARASYTRIWGHNTSQNLFPSSDIGMNTLTGNPPGISITGLFYTLGSLQNDYYSLDDTLEFSDQVSYVHGRHSFRFGFNWNINKWDVDAPGFARGVSIFETFNDFLVGESAAQNGSPNGFSNILADFSRIGPPPANALVHQGRTKNSSVFAQDDYKVNNRLTLNLGLRWEYIGNLYDVLPTFGNIFNSLAALVPIPPPQGTFVGYTVPSNYAGPLPQGVVRRSTQSGPASKPPLDNFAPRFGFAWTPGHSQSRFVVRGGYGWFFWENNGYTDGGDTVWNVLPVNYTYNLSLSSLADASLQNPFPNVPALPTFIPRTVSSQISDSNMAEFVKDSMVQQWSLNIQYQILPETTLEIGYVGARGAHLPDQDPSNQPVLATDTTPVNCGLPNTAAGLGVSPAAFAALGINSSGCVTTNTAANAQYRVPLVGYAPTGLSQTGFLRNSWYNALEVTARRNFSHGVSFQASYTYSKALADTQGNLGTSSYDDVNNPSESYGPSPFDRRNRFVASYLWAIPTRFKEGWQSKVTNGWSFAGVVTVQSGSALTLLDTRGGTAYGGADTSTAQLCSGSSFADVYSSGSTTQRIGQWFNPKAFCAPNIAPDGTATLYGNTGVGWVYGPGQNNWDLTLSKTTKVGGIRENAQLQFRAEFYNAFNHPQFANPALNAAAGNFGLITATSVAPRLIQFGLKYIF
jgi:outer membrane receptor protein involved in Fe transport